jgi:hypothetical protein
MAVLITADVKGQTQAGYDRLLAIVGPELERARGFIAHGAGEDERGAWRVFEIWETREDATRFFATHVRPLLPADVRPKRTFLDLNTLMLGRLLLLTRTRAPRIARSAIARPPARALSSAPC